MSESVYIDDRTVQVGVYTDTPCGQLCRFTGTPLEPCDLKMAAHRQE
jgi:hypothetical protein